MNTNIGRLTLLWILLTGCMPLVNAVPLSVDVSFNMVRSGLVDDVRCAVTSMYMNEDTFQALGLPSSARYKYRFTIPSVLSSSKFDPSTSKSPTYVLQITGDTKILTGDLHFSFILDKVCFNGDKCVNTHIEAKSRDDPMKFETLHFPLPNDDPIPVKTGFSMVSCDSVGLNRFRCPRAKIEIDANDFERIKGDKKFSFYFRKDKEVEISNVKLEHDSVQRLYSFETIDTDNCLDYFYYPSLILDQLCLQYEEGDENCVDAQITVNASQGDPKTQILKFPVP